MDNRPRDANHSSAGSGRLRSLAVQTWRLGSWVIGGYVVLVLMMMLLENSLIFYPLQYPAGDWDPRGVDVEDVYFEAADGTRLHGWYLPVENPRGYVLFSHGNAGNLTHRLPRLDRLRRQADVAVFVYDYRGYGRSGGRPSAAGVLDDARAAHRWLADRAGLEQAEIVLMGRSLGAAISVFLAAENGARGLVLESGFTSLPDVGAYHYPWLPVRLLMRSRLNAAEQIVRYEGPLLQSHGTADEIIPIELGRQLFEAAPGPKKFIELPGIGHNDPHPATYYVALSEMFERLQLVDPVSERPLP